MNFKNIKTYFLWLVAFTILTKEKMMKANGSIQVNKGLLKEK